MDQPQHLVLTLEPLDETPLSVLSHDTICFQYTPYSQMADTREKTGA